MNHTCSRCDNTWTAANACHCKACHRTFSSLSMFDRHRNKDDCTDPTTWGADARLDERDIWRGPQFDITTVLKETA